MGNDIDVLSQDDSIESTFWRLHGPQHESTFQFFRRGFNGFCNSISTPKRTYYSTSSLSNGLPVGFTVREFQITSRGNKLQCCHWNNQSCPVHDTSRKIRCIVYLHTNTRNLSDSTEVLPFAATIDAHLVGFDLPGAGKSEGKISTSMGKDVDTLLEWIKFNLGDNTEIIFWARGMSTAIVVEYMFEDEKQLQAQRNTRSASSLPIIYAILDTPFESIKLMIDNCIEKMKSNCGELPETLISVFGVLARRTITNQLNGDPFAVQPIKQCKNISTPCAVIATTQDDYVPLEQQVHIAEQWGGPCALKVIESGHFGHRPQAVVNYVYDSFVQHVETLSSLEADDVSFDLSANSSRK